MSKGAVRRLLQILLENNDWKEYIFCMQSNSRRLARFDLSRDNMLAASCKGILIA